MNKALIIAKQTFIENLSLKKTWIYFIFVVSITLLGLKLSIQPGYLNFIDKNAEFVSWYFLMGFFWIVGLPYMLYIGALSVNSVSKEINDGTIMLVFTRPLRRYEFLLGKFLGLFFYGLFINTMILFFVSSLVGIFYALDATIMKSLYTASFSLFFYNILLTFFIISFGMFLSSNIKKNIISMSVLFVLILSIFFIPPIINATIGSYQDKVPDLAFLLGSTSVKILETFGIDLTPAAKENIASPTGVFSNIYFQSTNLPSYVMEPAKVSNISLFLLVIIILILTSLLYYLGLLIIKKKEIY
ncbi:ABC transporter permease [Candidatus Woesearchaeota archaeon]|nr:ABC transporter permease [Candidatus Woesearchaeota archaeon]